MKYKFGAVAIKYKLEPGSRPRRRAGDWELQIQVELFFSSSNEVKPCGLRQQVILGMLRDVILQSRDSQSLNGEQP